MAKMNHLPHQPILLNNLAKMTNNALNYTILVMGSAYGTQSSYCAYQFCQSLIENTSHHIQSIFFYANGTLNANRLVNPANDEFNIVTAWQQFSEQYHIPLFVCIAAAQRRGIVNEQQQNNVATLFQCVGLGDLSDSITKSDRVIQF